MASKDEILKRVRQGRARTETLIVDALGGETVEASPLTADQQTEVDTTEMAGQTSAVDPSAGENAAGKVEVDMARTTEGRYRGAVLAARYGLGWAEDEVRELPRDAIFEIGDKVQQLGAFEVKEASKSGSG